MKCVFFEETFSREAVIPLHSPRPVFAAALVASLPEDALFDLAANLILRVLILSFAAKIAFCFPINLFFKATLQSPNGRRVFIGC